MLPLWARVDLGAMAMKVHSAFSKAPAFLDPHYFIGRVLPLCREAVGVFYSPSRLGHVHTWVNECTHACICVCARVCGCMHVWECVVVCDTGLLCNTISNWFHCSEKRKTVFIYSFTNTKFSLVIAQGQKYEVSREDWIYLQWPANLVC